MAFKKTEVNLTKVLSKFFCSPEISRHLVKVHVPESMTYLEIDQIGKHLAQEKIEYEPKELHEALNELNRQGRIGYLFNEKQSGFVVDKIRILT